MIWQLYIPALLLGLVSSFHCIGMCGPIALLLPVSGLPARQKMMGIILYNLGRVSTYMILGIFFGLVGRRIFIAGYQQGFSILLGSVILVAAIAFLLHKRLGRNYFGKMLIRNVQILIAKQMNRKGLPAIYLVGVANGFLPCSMVYFAMAGAMATGSISGGVLFMGAFGLGTLPLMILLHQFAGLAGVRTRNTVKIIVPYMVATMGLALIMRGMNLNIPYISPFFSTISGEAISCHS